MIDNHSFSGLRFALLELFRVKKIPGLVPENSPTDRKLIKFNFTESDHSLESLSGREEPKVPRPFLELLLIHPLNFLAGRIAIRISSNWYMILPFWAKYFSLMISSSPLKRSSVFNLSRSMLRGTLSLLRTKVPAESTSFLNNSGIERMNSSSLGESQSSRKYFATIKWMNLCLLKLVRTCQNVLADVCVLEFELSKLWNRQTFELPTCKDRKRMVFIEFRTNKRILFQVFYLGPVRGVFSSPDESLRTKTGCSKICLIC